MKQEQYMIKLEESLCINLGEGMHYYLCKSLILASLICRVNL